MITVFRSRQYTQAVGGRRKVGERGEKQKDWVRVGQGACRAREGRIQKSRKIAETHFSQSLVNHALHVIRSLSECMSVFVCSESER